MPLDSIRKPRDMFKSCSARWSVGTGTDGIGPKIIKSINGDVSQAGSRSHTGAATDAADAAGGLLLLGANTATGSGGVSAVSLGVLKSYLGVGWPG